jgi:hypothetical protein
MRLDKLAAKPQLVLITLDDEDTVKEYGEPLEFWTYDRQPLDVFMQLANIKQENQGEMINVVRQLILNDEGKQVIVGEMVLPTVILIRAISKIVAMLGKS